MSKPAARIGDMHVCPLITPGMPPIPHVGGAIIGPGVPTVLIGEVSPQTVVTKASLTILEQFQPKDSVITQQILSMQQAAMEGKPFCMECAKLEDKATPESTIQTILKESKRVTLNSEYALQELFKIAENDSWVMFAHVLIEIYGADIEVEAYKKLYADAKNNKIENPTIRVIQGWVNGKKAGYHKNTHEIHISENFIRAAENDNDKRGELMVALIEEFGHHIDYLLREVYSQASEDDAKWDEGANYAKYQLFIIDPAEKGYQCFGDAVIDGRNVSLKWEFEEIHQAVKRHIESRKNLKNDNVDDYEFFKAGHAKGMEEFAHGDIEEEALESSFRKYLEDNERGRKRKREILDTIYLGNWMRDYSQIIDPQVVRPMAQGMSSTDSNQDFNFTDLTEKNPPKTTSFPIGFKLKKLQPTYEYKDLDPVKISRKALTGLVELLAVKEFIAPKNKKSGKHIENYETYLKVLEKEKFRITPDALGVYRPEEHIDNPKGLGNNGKDRQMDPDFVGPTKSVELDIDLQNGMKNYIRSVRGIEKSTSLQYIISKLVLASRNQKSLSLAHFGAAMHTLEDYFAHSNFAEISLIKVWDDKVFPWVDRISETGVENVYMLSEKIINSGKKRVIPPPYKHNTSTNSKFENTTTKYNRKAECIPIVTGTFGVLDTAASLLPLLKEHFFSIEIDKYEDTKPGERTINDALIMHVLESLSEDKNDYVLWFERFLWLRDLKAKYDWEYLNQAIHYVSERIKVFFNFTFYFTVKGIAELINDVQVAVNDQLTEMENGTYRMGTDPTHTQLAKDEFSTVFHGLAGRLAVNAVERVAEKMFKVWFGNGKIEEFINEVEKIMVHPMKSDWQDPIVIKWAKRNKTSVCKGSSPSIVIDRLVHVLEEIREMKEHLQTSGTVNKIVEFIGKDKALELTGYINNIYKDHEKLIKRVDAVRKKWETKYGPSPECD